MKDKCQLPKENSGGIKEIAIVEFDLYKKWHGRKVRIWNAQDKMKKLYNL